MHRLFRLIFCAILSFLIVILNSFWRMAIAFLLCGTLGVNSLVCHWVNSDRATATQPPANAIAQQQSVGKFYIAYGPVRSEFYREFQDGLKNSAGMDRFAEYLNSFNLSLPVNVPIIFSECGQANAYYNPSKREIEICMDLTVNFVKIFYEDKPNTPREKIFNSAGQVTLFVMLHETGHALVHLLNLPITGKEEDAVDDLATVILLELKNEVSESAVLNAAISFALLARNIKDGEIAFWDEHSLEKQRFYNLICSIYGKNPGKYSALVQRKVLPESRAVRCGHEYAQKLNSWVRLLSSHVNNSPQPRNTRTPEAVYPSNPPPRPREPPAGWNW
jgi:hypothetical protein